MKFYLSAAIVFTALQANSNSIGPSSTWDNFRGYSPVNGCREVLVDDPGIYGAEAATLLDKQGNPWLKLAPGSLIKYKEGVPDKVVRGARYKAIRLVGVPNESAMVGDDNYAKKGITVGYIDSRLIRPLENFEITLTHETTLLALDRDGKPIPGADAIVLPHVANTGILSVGSVWQVAKRGHQYLTFNCGEAGKEVSFTVFDVFAAGDNVSTARIGVSKDSTRIFNDITTRKIDPSKSVNQHPTAVAPVPHPAPLNNAPMPTALKYVMCSANESAYLRNDNAEMNTPLTDTFEVKRMTEIVPFSFAPEQIRKVTINGKAIEYVKVSLPSAKASEPKTGWVAKDYVKRKLECLPPGQKPASVNDAQCAGGYNIPDVTWKTYAGVRCDKGDTDSFKCILCVLQGEAHLDSSIGQIEAARTVLERLESGKYPKNICKIAWASGQFVGLNQGDRIPADPTIAKLLVKSVKTALCKGGNGYLGWRACSYSRKGVDYGGNCFRKTGDAEDTDEYQRIMRLIGLNIESA